MEPSTDVSSDIHIEPFPRENLEAGARLYRDVFNGPPWNDEWTVETARTRLAQLTEMPGYYGYGVTLEETLVGFLMGYTEQWYTGKFFHLKEMCVDPDHRRCGIGTELLAHLVDHLERENVTRLYLFTLRDSPARAFYDERGFHLNEDMGMQSLQLG